jgi:5-methylcytosine-specific restriction endonuclease McrA
MQQITQRIRARARHRCESCGERVAPGSGQVDHRLPVALGGATSPSNLWLLCDVCAAAKTALDLRLMRDRRRVARRR